MLKGIYFMGWQRDMWNYHPSLPMKNMQMVEDIVDMHGNHADLVVSWEWCNRTSLYG